MIGLFNDCFPPIMDGVSITVQNYARWFSEHDRDICVVTPTVPDRRIVDSQHAPLNKQDNYPIYDYLSMPIPLRKPYRMGFPNMDPLFRHTINRIPFDLVHAHCPFSSGKVALELSRQQNIPFIATFHSKYRKDFEGAFSNKKVVDYLIRNVVNFYEQADEVWIPQASVEETLREYGYKGNVEVVENGNDFVTTEPLIHVRKQGRRLFGVSKNEVVFLFVGQHIYEKKPDLIIRSLSHLKDSRWKMFFIGRGNASEELKELVHNLNLENKITFLGQISDRDKLRQCYAAADLFLFPSLYDNAPLVVREAAAMGTPALISANSTTSEVITDGFNGFLAQPEEKAFSMTIEFLMHNTPLLGRVGENARSTIARSWSDILEEVHILFLSIRLEVRYNHLIMRQSQQSIAV